MKRYVIVFLFLLSMSSSILFSQMINDPKVRYKIGTGLSMHYMRDNISLIVDSYHFISAYDNISHQAIIKFGLGLNVTPSLIGNASDEFPLIGTSFTAGASLGYLYSLYQTTRLDTFGIGATVDYTFVGQLSHCAGVSVHLALNEFLVSLGTGLVLTGPEKLAPYSKISFGLSF